MITTFKNIIKMRHLAIPFLLLALFAGCKKNAGENPMIKPNWVVVSNIDKEFSMTYVAQVTVKAEIQPLVEGDELAAFIGDQCRGIATIVSHDNKNCFYLLIYGNQNDTEKLSFKFYSNQKKWIFETIPIDTYFPNQTVGSLDTPYLFEF